MYQSRGVRVGDGCSGGNACPANTPGEIFCRELGRSRQNLTMPAESGVVEGLWQIVPRPLDPAPLPVDFPSCVEGHTMEVARMACLRDGIDRYGSSR